jgi:hypothetical protein
MKFPRSLRWFLAGSAPCLIGIVLRVLGPWDFPLLLGIIACFIMLYIVFVSPLCFLQGVRLSLEEDRDGVRIARVSRWLNIVGVAVWLGIIVTAAMLFLILYLRHSS